MPEEYEATESKAGPLAALQNTKLPLWVSVLLLLLLIAVFAWKQIAVGNVESRAEEEKQQITQQAEADKTAQLAQSSRLLSQNSEAAHQLLGTVLSWAIRSELIRNNLDQIDQFFSELVKRERVKLAVLSNQDGKLLVASDKKFQNSEFGQVFPTDLLTEASISIHPGQNGEKLLVMPIMGLNNRLGTAVLSYMPEQMTPGN
jgi:hypothetical protein